jgi:hypothetical protein
MSCGTASKACRSWIKKARRRIRRRGKTREHSVFCIYSANLAVNQSSRRTANAGIVKDDYFGVQLEAICEWGAIPFENRFAMLARFSSQR